MKSLLQGFREAVAIAHRLRAETEGGQWSDILRDPPSGAGLERHPIIIRTVFVPKNVPKTVLIFYFGQKLNSAQLMLK